MNVVVLSGRLVKPPKAGTSSNGKGYVLFTLAVRKNKEEADFIDCLAYDADEMCIRDRRKTACFLNAAAYSRRIYDKTSRGGRAPGGRQRGHSAEKNESCLLYTSVICFIKNFCRARLCPMCSWRRGLKLYGTARKILNEAYNREPQGKALLLTLTVRNCEASELKRVIQRMSRAFSLMFRDSVSFKGIVGWIRNTEITHDIEMHITPDMYYGNKDKHIYSRKDYYKKNGLKIGDINPNYNLYHPHLHCLLFAGKDYFDKYYAKQEQFQKDWVTSVSYTHLDVYKRQGLHITAMTG